VFWSWESNTLLLSHNSSHYARGGDNLQEKPFFSAGVIVTNLFCHYWLKLTPKQRKLASKKILLLAKNHRHPGLRAHPLHRCPGKWGCSLSKTERLVYSRCRGLFILHAVGGHEVIDQAHLHRFDCPDPETE
jgi:hypothetical protein